MRQFGTIFLEVILSIKRYSVNFLKISLPIILIYILLIANPIQSQICDNYSYYYWINFYYNFHNGQQYLNNWADFSNPAFSLYPFYPPFFNGRIFDSTEIELSNFSLPYKGFTDAGLIDNLTVNAPFISSFSVFHDLRLINKLARTFPYYPVQNFEQEKARINNVYRGDCKEINTLAEDTEGESFSFEFNDGLLYIHHINALYNCCIEEISVTMEIEANIINLYETEILDQGGCNCLCPIDITSEINDLSFGNYILNIYKNDILAGQIIIDEFDFPENATVVYDPNTPAAYDPNDSVIYDPNTPAGYDPNDSVIYDPNTPAAYDPNDPVIYDPNTTAAYDPNDSVIYDPNTPAAYDPNDSVIYDPNTPAAYDPNDPVVYDLNTSQEIREEQCDSGLAIENPMSNCVNLSSPDFEDLEIVFCTQKARYSLLDACIPLSIAISNTGSDDIHLSKDQAEDIASDYIGVYGKNIRFMKVYLNQTAGPAIQPGVFLKPGESATLSAMLDRDRVALYTAPPLSGGIVKRTLDFQGPWGTLGLGRILASIDIDFGELPDSRVYDPGADIDFVAGNLIVGFKEDIKLEEVEAFIDKYHCHIKNILEMCNLNAVIWIPFELTTGEVMDAMLNDPDRSKYIEYIERNRIVKIIYGFDPPTPNNEFWNFPF